MRVCVCVCACVRVCVGVGRGAGRDTGTQGRGTGQRLRRSEAGQGLKSSCGWVWMVRKWTIVLVYVSDSSSHRAWVQV